MFSLEEISHNRDGTFVRDIARPSERVNVIVSSGWNALRKENISTLKEGDIYERTAMCVLNFEDNRFLILDENLLSFNFKIKPFSLNKVLSFIIVQLLLEQV